MSNLSAIKQLNRQLPVQQQLMPVLFTGHGSPMNGIEDNLFSREWAALPATMPVPRAVIVVSAHWYTRGTAVTAMDFPETIHDFGGFPRELFAVQYPAPGSPEIAAETAGLLQGAGVTLDHDWGLDHGAWTILRHMFPAADIPVLQLSIDYTKSPAAHYELAGELAQLRRRGVLIMGSGNMVHNLRMLDYNMMSGGGYDWALEVNAQFRELILNHDHASLIRWEQLGSAARLAIPTPEHYLPLLYTLGLQEEQDEVMLFNDRAVGGAITMTSVRIG